MNADETLARLRAGLDRTERLARAAMPSPGARWVKDADGDVWAANLSSPDRCDHHPPGVPNMCEDIMIGPDPDFDPKSRIADYMIAQQPIEALRVVEVLREIVAMQERHSDAKYPDFDGGYATALDHVVELLARIYEEEV